MTFYCTNCWKEIEKDRPICPHCHAEQERLAEETFVAKLIRALRHPEPETPIRAAYILGELRAREAVDELAGILYSSPDPYIAAACAVALGKIGGASALAILRTALNESHSVIVKRTAQIALQRHQQSEPSHG